jgi:hypothetical protein
VVVGDDVLVRDGFEEVDFAEEGEEGEGRVTDADYGGGRGSARNDCEVMKQEDGRREE